MTTEYSLAQAGAEDAERERLGLLERVCDPMTTRMLDSVGVEKGWRCLDVGAGAGSVTTMLAELVGPQGAVLAIDLDTRLLDDLASDVIEVRRHDLLAEPAGTDFDLVHARHLLMHLRSRRAAIECMVSALRPEGVLAIGDVTMADVQLASWIPQWERGWSATLDAMVAVGWDPAYGDRLTGDLEAVGLADVTSEQIRAYQRGGSFYAQVLAGTIERLRDRVEADPADIDEMIRLLADPATAFVAPTVVMAWGRRR